MFKEIKTKEDWEEFEQEQAAIDRSYGLAEELKPLGVECNLDKEYFGAAATKNCIWVYQERIAGEYHPRAVFLTIQEAKTYRDLECKDGPCNIVGIPCGGTMAALIGKHLEDNDFKDGFKKLIAKGQWD